MGPMGPKKGPAADGVSDGGLKELVDQSIPRTTKNINRKFYFDHREFRGAYYWERGFLSCVMAGAEIPAAIAAEHFRMPWNRAVFEALRSISALPPESERERFALLSALLARHPWFDGNFKAYLSEIRDMIAVPSAAHAFAAKLVELKAGVNV